jgi:hypothetical protein
MAFFGSASRTIRETQTRVRPQSAGPVGPEELTPFPLPATRRRFTPIERSVDAVHGKVTHLSGAPLRDLWTVWSPGPTGGLSDEVSFTGS